jgi:hypothetical protein
VCLVNLSYPIEIVRNSTRHTMGGSIFRTIRNKTVQSYC